MEIYFEEVFNYIQPGLLGKFDLKAYSDDKISFLIAVSDFSEMKELGCSLFTILFKGQERAKKVKESPEEKWIMTWKEERGKTFFKKNIKANNYLINIFNQIINEIIRKEAGGQYIIQSLNIQMLINLLRIIEKNFNKKYHKIQAEKTLKYLLTILS